MAKPKKHPMVIEFDNENLSFLQWLKIIQTDDYFTRLFDSEYTLRSAKYKKGLIYKYGKIDG